MGRKRCRSWLKRAVQAAKLREFVQYLKYNFIGIWGVVLNLIVTFVLTEFFFGHQNYIYAFLIGTFLNLVYNYLAFMKYVFPTGSISQKKKAAFFSFSLLIVALQLLLADSLVSILGYDLYFPVLIIVIWLLSVVSFFIFRDYVFTPGDAGPSSIQLMGVILTCLLTAVIFLVSRGGGLFWDEAVYIAMGKYIFSGGQLGMFEVFRPPVMPLALGFFWLLGLNPIVAGHFVILLFSSGCIILTFLLAKKLIGGEGALLAALALALAPSFVFYSSRILTDIPSLFFSLLAFYLISDRQYFSAGLCAGVSIMTRFPNGTMILAAAFFFLLEFLKERNLKSVLPKAAFFSMGAFLAVFPFALYNYIVFGNPALPFIKGSEVIGMVGAKISEGALYYPQSLLLESIFLALAPIGAYFVLKEGSKKNHLLWSTLFFSAVLFAYFSLLARKETRYMLVILPYLFILSSYSLGRLRLGSEKIKKFLAAIVFLALFLQLLFGLQAYQKAFVRPIDSEIYQNYLARPGENLTILSSPVPLAFQDFPYRIIYYTNPDLFFHYERYSPLQYRINTCELFCEEEDEKCRQAKEKFIKDLGVWYVVKFNKSYMGCDYYVFDKPAY